MSETKISEQVERDEAKQREADRRRCRKVESAIYKRATGYKVSVKKTYKVKRVEYDPDTGKKTSEREELEIGVDEVHVPADVKAGAYWLTNRDPERWKEHPDGGETDGDEASDGGVIYLPEVKEKETPPKGI